MQPNDIFGKSLSELTAPLKKFQVTDLGYHVGNGQYWGYCEDEENPACSGETGSGEEQFQPPKETAETRAEAVAPSEDEIAQVRHKGIKGGL